MQFSFLKRSPYVDYVINLFQNQVEEAVKVLLALKADYKSATGKDWKPGAHKPAAQEQSKAEKQSTAPAQMSAAASKLNWWESITFNVFALNQTP